METQEVHVKAHTRLIRQRIYRFICKNCKQAAERVCYPSQPLYCERCRPPKMEKRKKPSQVTALKKKRRATTRRQEDIATSQ